MTDPKINPTDPENDDLNDLLKALNDGSGSETKQPVKDEKEEDTDDLNDLRGLFSDDIPPTEKQENPSPISDGDDLDDMLSALIEPANGSDQTLGTPVFNEETITSDDNGSDDLDSRLRDMISELDEDPVANITSAEPGTNSEDDLIIEIGEETQSPIVEEAKAEGEPTSAEQTIEKQDEDLDLDDLKQYIQFDDKSAKPKRKTMMDRLNSDTPRKDPIALSIFAILAIILVALLGFVISQVATNPAWHPTPTPTATQIIDTTEVYITGLNFSGTIIPVKPSGDQLNDWNPTENEALVIPGGYFCRLIYLNQNTEAFATAKLGQVLFVTTSDKDTWNFEVAEIDSKTFEEFKGYVGMQQECVAIYIADASRILLLERVR